MVFCSHDISDLILYREEPVNIEASGGYYLTADVDTTITNLTLKMY